MQQCVIMNNAQNQNHEFQLNQHTKVSTHTPPYCKNIILGLNDHTMPTQARN